MLGGKREPPGGKQEEAVMEPGETELSLPLVQSQVTSVRTNLV